MATNRTPSVPEWFANKNVLVTGGTGFMGKALVSKLLLSCPDLGCVFLLIREKKGCDPHSRLQSMMQQEPFRVLREHHPDRLKKIEIISGDTSVKGMALSNADRERLINEVSVIFHAAANVRFDLSLSTAIKINTGSTANVIELAKQMPHLESFIHISTAYSQCGEEVLEERAYPTDIRPEKVLSMIEDSTDNALESIEDKLLKNQPNTYALSKALSEDLISRCGLPAGVVRPSIVVCSAKEPAPGWVDNMNGPTGLITGAGKGVVRSMLCNPDYTTDVIPCDMAINATIVFAWRVGLKKPEKTMFMNVVEGGQNPISWRDALNMGRKHIYANPFSGVLWYPGGGITTSKILHYISVIFFHLIPAYFLDAVIILTGNKPFLIKVQNRVSAGLGLLQYYTTKQWIFRKDAMEDLQNHLSPTDRETFFMDTKIIRWDEFLLIYVLGIRKYVLKDDLKTLPRARQVLRYYHIADWCVKALLIIFICWMIYSWIVSYNSTAMTIMGTSEI